MDKTADFEPESRQHDKRPAFMRHSRHSSVRQAGRLSLELSEPVASHQSRAARSIAVIIKNDLEKPASNNVDVSAQLAETRMVASRKMLKIFGMLGSSANKDTLFAEIYHATEAEVATIDGHAFADLYDTYDEHPIMDTIDHLQKIGTSRQQVDLLRRTTFTIIDRNS